MSMPRTADVVIIGGGITGNSIAWHLAKRQAKVILLEKEKHVGRGATAYSAGGVREQFSSRVNIAMSRYSLDRLATFPEEMDQDIDYKRAGYLFLAVSEAAEAALRRNVDIQNEMGVQSRLIDARQAREIVRDLNVDDVRLAAHNARDGYVDPTSICSGYNARARDLGVDIQTRTKVTGMQVAADRVTTVETSSGNITAGHVVNAAGPYLHQMGLLAGVDIPAQPYRRMLFITEKFALGDGLLPLTVDMDSGFYFRQEGEGLMIGLSDRDEPSSFNTTLDWDYLPAILEQAVHRIPTVESAEIGKGWAGLYTITPDHHALLGAFPERSNFIVAGGFSGHGIMHSPAAGRAIAEIILDGRSHTIDVSSLAPARVREGRLLSERNVI